MNPAEPLLRFYAGLWAAANWMALRTSVSNCSTLKGLNSTACKPSWLARRSGRLSALKGNVAGDEFHQIEL